MKNPGGAVALDEASEKRALLRRLLVDRQSQVCPLSFAQERMWFLEQLTPGTTNQHILHVLRIRARLDPQLMEQAWRHVVARHDVLRARIAEHDGVVRQIIQPHAVPFWEHLDLSALPEELGAGKAAEMARRLSQLPFELSRAPLLRLGLAWIGANESVLILVMHHIIGDNHSVERLLQEARAIYIALQAGDPPDLPAPVTQYGKFAAWQRSQQASVNRAADVRWWRRQLEGFSQLEFPLDSPRRTQGIGAAKVSRLLGAELTEAIRKLQREEGVTAFVLTLAAFKVSLAKYVSQWDITVGTVITGRSRPELLDAVGPYMNDLVLRTDLSADPTFRELLQRVRYTVVEAFQHQDVPFEMLVKELQWTRDALRHPFFDVLFLFLHEVSESVGEGLGAMDVGHSTAKLDVSFLVVEERQHFVLICEYNSRLFDRQTMEIFCATVEGILAQVAAAPDSRLTQLVAAGQAGTAHRPAADLGELSPALNDTARVWPPETVVEMIRPQLTGRAGFPALLEQGDEWSYERLDRESARVARHLRASGIGCDDVVAVCLERSAQQVAALLGILRAGAAYLPIEPTLPSQRIGFILTDSRTALLICATPPAGWHGRSESFEQMGLVADEETWPEPRPDALAYVIYTSGSTGFPKGVMITQRGLANLVRWQMELFSVNAGQRGGYLCGLGFDATILELWAFLAAGASIVIAPEETRADPPRLRDWIASSHITTIFAPTPLAEKLMELSWEGTSLRCLLAGGDRLTRPLPARIPWQLWNIYGPTEATVVTTTTLVESELPAPPIGRPVANMQCYVLDAGLRPVPQGEAGELFVGGVGVARGYRARPAMTAERFIPNPYGNPGERLYRTGDLVRRLGTGELEFIGRTDNQVKIRGFRIEPGEIESALRRLPGVRETVVVPRADSGNTTVLVAYIVWRDMQEQLPPVAVRARLSQMLPDYMIPAAVVSLELFPLNPNGKVDRGALPRPARADSFLEPPLPGLETELAQLWCQLLDLDRVGRNESFLELGGHSLLATQLAARLRASFGVEIQLGKILGEMTVAGLAQAIRSWRQSNAHAVLEPVVQPVGRGRPLPCSYAQERLWFLQQLEPGSSAYNVALPVRMRGTVDPLRLEDAIKAVLARQEALRTVFEQADGQPYQRFSPVADRPLRVVHAASEAEAVLMMRAEAERPFDLAKGPLARWILLELNAADRFFLIAMHHLITDGWSLGILLNELALAYQGQAPLAPLRIEYGDYAVWQRSWLDEARLTRQLEYWRDTLAGAAPLLELPLDRPRPALQGEQGAVHRFVLSSALTGRLRAFARERGATLFMVLLAGFVALLHRLSGQTDIVLSTPVAGRTLLEVEEIAGFFVNTLVLRSDAGGEPSFTEMVSRVRQTVLEAFSHQELPFHRLVEELAPERTSAWDPIVQAMFELQNIDPFRHPIDGVQLEFQPFEQRSAKFDLALIVTEAPHEDILPAVFEYRTNLFDATTIERLGREWVSLLDEALEQPAESIGRIGVRQSLPVAAPVSVAERRGCVVTLFQEWVASQPQQIALVDGGDNWTYAQLDRECRHIAVRLRARGIGPESLVAVHMPRSARQVATMLGVLMSGAAYLPIDASYPEDRVAYMLRDSGAVPIDLLLDDAVAPGVTDEEQRSWAPMLSGSLAYVIYTSGSTGAPKGVMVSHANLLNQTLWMREQFALHPGDRVPYKGSAGFDASLLETLIPLALGCTVLVLPAGREYDPQYLAGFLGEHAATYMDIVPALLQALLSVDDLRGMPALRLVTCGGEALPPALAAATADRLGGTLFNTYGPTEATVQSTFWDCRLPAAGSTVPIGLPIANTSCCVLDGQMRPVPAGAVGELYIGGAGVTRGYLKQPGLTADRFCPDPFSGGGARLYRTGDRVRRRFSGELEFLGRTDQQVKLRGFRIEPGEIEVALAEAAHVAEAFVVLREDCGPQPILVGYVVRPPRGALPGPEEMRERLAKRLPEYMLPAAIIEIERAPLTAHGKVDRKAFPRPELTRAALDPPRTGTEQIIAGIWERLLGLKGISRTDNFFALGGHSLLATQVISRIRLELGATLPLRSLFEHPRLADMARAVEMARSLRKEDEPALEPLESRDGAELSFAQRRLWFLDRLEPGSATYNIPIQSQLLGALDVERLETAIQQVVRRHEILRTVYLQRGDHLVQSVVPVPEQLLRKVQVAGEQEAIQLARLEASSPFDLAAGPVARWTLVHWGADRHWFLITVHHIAFDAWSLQILIQELAQAYRGEALGPALKIQYADYAHWQRQWVAGGLSDQLNWWRQKMSGAPALIDLPLDRPRPLTRALSGALYSVQVDAQLTGLLQELATAANATLYMVLLAATVALLSRYSGQEDLVVGSAVSGRERLELEGLIGLFVNTLVLRADLSGNPTFAELLERTRAMVIDAHAHGHVPFERVIEELAPQRNLTFAPVAQVMFAFEKMAAPLLLAGLEAESLPITETTAKFDLTLYVQERQNGLVASFEYRTDIFDEATIARLARHWRQLLLEMARGPQRAFQEVRLLSEEERASVLAIASGGERVVAPVSIPAAISRYALSHPDAPALLQDGSIWTYGRLDEEASRIARGLADRGIGAEQIVAVCMRRSVWQIAALLGVMKSGAGYLPIDPEYPAERIRYMKADSGAVLLIDEDELNNIRAVSGRPLCAQIDFRQVAYLIYTSGSTGLPKAVAVTHGNLANFVAWYIQHFAIGPQDRGTYCSGLGFDATVWELWPLLAAGASVALAPEQARFDPELFRDWLLRDALTVPYAPTPLAEKMPHLAWPESAALRLLTTGGDRLTTRPPAGLKWQLFNNYGPTETTVVATSSVVNPDEQGLPSIGKPIANAQCYLLDAFFEPVPPRASGELYIGGANVARGYWGKPALTAERFVPDPFGPPGSRMYRSGDLARARPDGGLEFLGRADDQVKLRGVRIELGEVEAALRRIEGIAEAVVSLQSAPAGEPLLAAYVVAAPGCTLPPMMELRGLLSEHLPEHMIPAAIVALPKLPLTAHGKVDRKSLPSIASERPPWEEPEAGLERRIAAIWADALRIPTVGRFDSFFALGGHSLLAAQVVARIGDELGIELPVNVFFRSSDLKSFAESVRNVTLWPAREPLVSLSYGESDPVILVHGVDGGLAMYLALAQHLAPGRALFGLPAPQLTEIRAIKTLTELAERHAQVLLDRFGSREYTLAGWSYGGLLALEIARSLQARARPVRTVMIDTQVPDGKPFEAGQVLALMQQMAAPPSATALLEENLRLLRTYEPRVIDAEALLIRASQSQLGAWPDLVRHLRVKIVEGGHFDIMRAPRVQQVGIEL